MARLFKLLQKIPVLSGLALLVALAFGPPASAQSSIYSPGDLIVTGFAGIKQVQGLKPYPDPLDGFFIDPDGASMRIFSAGAMRTGPNGQLVPLKALFSLRAGDIGQVFAVALDDGNGGQPNIYLGATSAFGLNIVIPDASGAKRVSLGAPGAVWMDGQFGTAKGGTPGSIWRVDAATGNVSLFATIPNNSGPGIGGIAYDKAGKQFFASDLDTGLIYRIDATGKILGSFDHGVAGLPLSGKPPVSDDGSQANIASPAFNSEEPRSWGLTQKERRVMGLAVSDGRLYYAVGPQVWSIGIANGFANDARLEFDLSALPQSGTPTDPSSIASMLFDSKGDLYLSQRGDLEGHYDYSVFAKAGRSKVFRLRKSDAGWQQADYAIGFPPEQKFAAGGVALGYGYNSKGKTNGQCDATVWSTGDLLRNDPRQQAGGPLIVHGLQGNSTSLVRPANAPEQAYFIDYDGVFNDPEAEGHVGSVAIYQPCSTAAQNTLLGIPVTPQTQDQSQSQSSEPDSPNNPDNPGSQSNLSIQKTAAACVKQGVGYNCDFTVTVTNTGPAAFSGDISVNDPAPNGTSATISTPGPFTCSAGPAFVCTASSQSLNVNDSISFVMTVTTPMQPNMQCQVTNTAQIFSPPGGSDQNSDPIDDTASATATITDPNCNQNPPPKGNPSLKIEKKFEDCAQMKTGDWTCRFQVRYSNTTAVPYTGPFEVIDTPSAGTLALAGGCNGNNPGNPLPCTKNPVTIPANYVSAWGTVVVTIPASQVKALGCKIDNTIKITQGPVLNPADGQAQASGTFNDPVCNQNPPSSGNPSLKVEKKFDSCTKNANGDWLCKFEVQLTNTSASTYVGPFELTDTPSAGTGAYIQSIACNGSPANPANPMVCHIASATIKPGPSGWAPAYVVVPASQVKALGCKVDNTIKITQGPVLNPADGQAQASGTFSDPVCNNQPSAQPSFTILKQFNDCNGQTPNGDFLCSFTITVTNMSGAQYNGTLTIMDTPSEGKVYSSQGGCSPASQAAAASQMTCTIPGFFGPNSSIPITAYVAVPGHDFKPGGCKVNNTVSLTGNPPISGTLQSQASGIISFPECKQQAPDLSIQKTFDSCSPARDGYDCTFDVHVTNKGQGAYNGQITFTDAPMANVSLPVTNTVGDFQACTGGGGTYTCTSKPQMTLNPGQSTGTVVTVHVTKDEVSQLKCQIKNRVTLTQPATNIGSIAAGTINDPECTQPHQHKPPHCPPGYTLDGDNCVSTIIPPFIPGCRPNPDNNFCCPEGSEWNGRYCSTPTPPPGFVPVPIPFPVPNPSPNCIPSPDNNHCCPNGSLWSGRACYTPPSNNPGPSGTVCQRNEHQSSGHCCPFGENWNGRSCSTPGSTTGTTNGQQNCPPNEIWDFRSKSCVTRKDPGSNNQTCTGGRTATASHGCACPANTSWNGSQCASNVHKQCPAGMTGNYPNCRRRMCPRGTTGTPPNCTRDIDKRRNIERRKQIRQLNKPTLKRQNLNRGFMQNRHIFNKMPHGLGGMNLR